MRSVPLRMSRPGPVLPLAGFGGGGGGPVPLLPGLRLCAPLGAGLRVWGVQAPGGRGGGGAPACALSSLVVPPGGPVGRGVALPRSVPLPSLGVQQSGCLWRPSGHGRRGPHTALVRAHVLSPGVVRVASLCAGVGLLAHRGPRRSRRLGGGGAWRTGPAAPSPPPGSAVLPGGGQTVLPALVGVGGRSLSGPRVGRGGVGG